jgi:hypothetical protein
MEASGGICMIPVANIYNALIESGGVTAFLTILSILLINIAKFKTSGNQKWWVYLSLKEAIKSTTDEFPSLANLQLFMWSVLIVFAFLTVYFVRLSGGEYDPPSGILPENILKILAISAVVPAASLGLNFNKYRTAYITSIALAPGSIGNRFRGLDRGWSSILLEGGSSSITRLQMFVWTWIGIFIYLIVFFGYLYTLTLSSSTTTPYNDVRLPDVDPTLLVLMGISQGSFVAGKVASPQFR